MKKRFKYLLILFLINVSFRVHSQENEYIDSLYHVIQTVEKKCSSPCDDDTLRIQAYLKLAEELSYAGTPDSSIRICKKVIQICNAYLKVGLNKQYLNYKIRMLRIGAYIDMGFNFNAIKNYDKQIVCNRKALKLCDAPNNLNLPEGISPNERLEKKALALRCIGLAHMDKSQIDSAQHYTLEAASLYEKIKNPLNAAYCLNNLGIALNKVGQPNKAQEVLLKSLKLRELALKEVKNKEDSIFQLAGLSTAYNNLSFVFSYYKNYDKVLEYNQKALDIAEKTQNKSSLGYVYSNRGAFLSEIGDKDSAIYFYRKALHYRLQIQEIGEISETYLNIGGYYSDVNQQDSAIYYFLKSYEYAQKTGEDYRVMVAASGVASGYYRNGYYKKAKPYAKEFITIAQKMGNTEYILKGYYALRRIYTGLGNYEKAYDYILKHENLSDSLDKVNDEKNIYEQEAKFEYEKKAALDSLTHANDLLVKNMELAKEQEKSAEQQRLISIFLIGLLGLTVLLVVIFRLLRQRNKTAIQLKETNEKLMELDQFKRNMSSMIVHDLKNPLNVIMGMSEKMEVKEAAGKMNRLVMNILDTQKFEDTQVELQYKDHVLNHLVEASFEQVAYLAESKDIQLTNAVPADLVIKVDEELVTRVVVNLLLNAIKYSNSGGEVVVAANQLKDHIEIEVQDQGKGISKDFLPYIFEKFKGKEVTEAGKGIKSTGIGLTFCKLVVEAHGGRISVESEEGKGTTVRFTLLTGDPSKVEASSTIRKKEVKETKLSKEEQLILSKYAVELEKLEVYYLSDIMQLLDQIEESTSGIKQWKADVKIAVESCNETIYQKLIDQVKQEF